ncbi:MAG: hypothetical protein ACJAWS_002682 [Oleiphilaceae bacterium]|jgi:hypothetical protein
MTTPLFTQSFEANFLKFYIHPLSTFVKPDLYQREKRLSEGPPAKHVFNTRSFMSAINLTESEKLVFRPPL